MQKEVENKIKKTADQMGKLLGEPARKGFLRTVRDLGLSQKDDMVTAATSGVEESLGMSRLQGVLENISKAGKTMGAVFDPLFKRVKQGAVAAASAIAAMGGASFAASKSIEGAEATIARDTGATGEELASLKGVFRDVAASADDEYGVVATVVADLNTRLRLSGEVLRKSAETTLDAAEVSGEGAASISTAATKAMNAWGLQAETYPDVLDKFYAASQKTGASVTGLSEKMAQSAPILKDLGFGFEGSIALLAEFERNGVEADQMLAGMKHSLATFAKDGVKDASSAFPALVESIRSAKDAAIAAAIAIDAFGSKAGPTLASAIRQGRFSVDELAASLSKSSGLVQKTAVDTEGLGAKWNKSMHALGIAFDPVGSKLVQFGKWVANGASAVAGWVQKSGLVQHGAEAFASGLGLILPSVEDVQESLDSFDTNGFVKGCKSAGETAKDFFGALKSIATEIPWEWLAKNIGTITEIIVGGWAAGKILSAANAVGAFVGRLQDLKSGLLSMATNIAAHPVAAAALLVSGMAAYTAISLKLSGDSERESKRSAAEMEKTSQIYREAVGGNIASLDLLEGKYKTMAEESLKAKDAVNAFGEGVVKGMADIAGSLVKSGKSKGAAVDVFLGSYREELTNFATAADARGRDAKAALLEHFTEASKEVQGILSSAMDAIRTGGIREETAQVRDLGSEFGRLAQYIPLLFKGTKDDTERIIGLLKTNPAAGLKEFADKANTEIQRIRGNVEPIAKLLTSGGLSGDAVKRGGAYVQEQLAKLRTFYEALSLSTEGLKDQPEEIRRAWIDANVKGEIDKIGMAAKDALAQSKSDVSAVMEAMKSGAMTRSEMASGWEFVKGKVRDVAGLIRKDISERMTGIPAALHDAIARSDLKKYLDSIGGQWLPSFVKKLQDEAQRVMGKSVDIGKMLGVPSQLSDLMKQVTQSKPASGGTAGAAGSPAASGNPSVMERSGMSAGPAAAFASAFDAAVSSLSSALERNAATVERNTTALRDLAAQIKSGARAVNVTMGSVTVKDTDEGHTLGKQLGQGILSPSF